MSPWLCAVLSSQAELRHMIETGSRSFALRRDKTLEQIHWATTRRRRFDELLAFAFDHRSQFRDMAAANGRSDADIDHFKTLAFGRGDRVCQRPEGSAFLVDDRFEGRRFTPPRP